MIVVIQCAGTKRPDAGFLRTPDGRRVFLVAHPELAPPSLTHVYAHPDHNNESGITWRDLLSSYNSVSTNPLGLSRAFELYTPPAAPLIYRQLVDRLGLERVFVLSAGWGLIRADYLTPCYDITFAREVLGKAPWKHRRADDAFRDYCHLPKVVHEEIVFIGSKSYVRLFCVLTKNVTGHKTVYYNSAHAPSAAGCDLEAFPSDNKRTWQYDCARSLLERV